MSWWTHPQHLEGHGGASLDGASNVIVLWKTTLTLQSFTHYDATTLPVFPLMMTVVLLAAPLPADYVLSPSNGTGWS